MGIGDWGLGIGDWAQSPNFRNNKIMKIFNNLYYYVLIIIIFILFKKNQFNYFNIKKKDKKSI